MNPVTKSGILVVVCAAIKGRLEEVEWVTVRLDAELSIIDFSPNEDTYDRRKE